MLNYKSPLVLAFTIGTLSLGFSYEALADTIDVPGDAPSISWAVDIASSGDNIVLSDGIYYE